MRDSPRRQDFRAVLRNMSVPLIGTFVKTPSPHVVEILGNVGFDFLVLDAEHAAFDRTTLDQALLAASAVDMPAVVRVPSNDARSILAALDDGADGVMVPHIATREQAEQLVGACRYSKGRGFSNSPRAGGYGASAIWDHVVAQDQRVSVIAMVEDPQAVSNIEEILSVDGIDAVFIGRGDLAVAMDDRQPGAPAVQTATARVIDAAVTHGKPVWLLPSSAVEAATFVHKKVSGFIVSSDQGLMRAAALQAAAEFATAVGRPRA